MSREVFWLVCTVILTGILWIPYTLDRIKVRGVMGAMDNPKPGDKPQSPWAMRLYFAHTNAVENLVLFAPLVLIPRLASNLDAGDGRGLRHLFLGTARACHHLRDGHQGAAHTRLDRELHCADRAGAGGLREGVRFSLYRAD